MFTLRAAFAASTLLASVALAAPTANAGVLPVTSGNLSILTPGDATIVDGATIWGTNIAAGDVNGDGKDDVALTYADGSVFGTQRFGRIIYGAASPGVASPAAAAARGWTIMASDENADREIALSGTGDLDGDGLDDVAALFPSPYPYDALPGGILGTVFHGEPTAGRTSQIGAAGPRTTQLLVPAGIDQRYPRSVERLGDLNGDGFGDFVVVWPGSEGARVFGTVIFGAATWPASIDLAAPGARGFLIKGFMDTTALPVVRAAGDFNGDGLDDLTVSNRTSANTQLSTAVIFGSASTAPVDLAVTSLGARGIRLNLTRKAYPWGDLDGDGFDDLLVLGTSANAAGRSFVVKGRTGNANVTLGAGFQTLQVEFRDARPAGDVNGDGRPDILGDLPMATGLGAATKPTSALVFGPASTAATATITLSQATANPAQGIRFFGEDTFENRRASPSAAGDFNGDGHADLLVRVGRTSYELPETTHSLFFGYGAGTPTPVDTTPPVITNWFTAKDTLYGTCGFFGQRYFDGIGMSFTSNEEGTFEVTTTGTGGTKTGTVKFGLGPQNVFLPSSFAPRAAHVRTVTVVPVDAAGNRGTALTGTTNVKSGAWRLIC